MRVDEEGGRRAISRFHVIDSAGDKVAWLALSPLTGRTHQLRVHCAAIGCPILGDGKYGGRDAFLTGFDLAKRVHLHARAIAMPWHGAELRVEAPLPPRSREELVALRFRPEPGRCPAMSRRLVLFDCDGTLVDSQRVIHEAMSFAFRDHGLMPLPRRDVRGVIGLPLDTAIARLFPSGSSDQIAGLAQSYKEAFVQLRQRVGHQEPLFDGMRDVIDTLDAEDALLGIVTGKGSQGLAMVLAQHGLSERFVTLQTADTAPGKPDPGMVNQAIAETGAQASNTVVIGDTTFDMAMAVAAGVPAIGVAWGLSSRRTSGGRRSPEHRRQPGDLHGAIEDVAHADVRVGSW